MAPEYYSNNGYQTEVDVWGFGLCVIEMATLSIPYADDFGENVNAIKEAVIKV
jgi:serine/threonine protein kinase